MKSVTLGGDRLGAGKKQKVQMHGFERSTHDLGYVWRNTQAPGTLVPFMNILALPGDTFDIDLAADVKTHPTVGPLFASFKLQLDVFECPIRLYHAWLHNNKLKIGNDMSKVKLPQMVLDVNPLVVPQADGIFPDPLPIDQQQINPSSLLSYLGIKGVGQGTFENTIREFNAVPYLGYWDIYKNYYANKQEEKGAFLNANSNPYYFQTAKITDGGSVTYFGKPWGINYGILAANSISVELIWTNPKKPEFIYVFQSMQDNPYNVQPSRKDTSSFTSTWDAVGNYWVINLNVATIGSGMDTILWGFQATFNDYEEYANIHTIAIQSFPLENIDTMRENILAATGTNAYKITSGSITPYGEQFQKFAYGSNIGQITSVATQQGLALKTYQSDMFNNWLNTEWIDGAGGINEITSVNTADGSFDINSLNLAQKVYDMLNRIAVSGGTYEDWLSAVYDHDSFRRAETPMYHGGLSKEIIFEEVISKAHTEDEPLGTLAGKGKLSSKNKGGKVSIKVNEPSYIIGIVSITPRIDYYQGNDFHVNHKTMNDLHKPSLDEIGFQELITDKMAFWDTKISDDDGSLIYKSAGKQPAWLDYMTAFNKLHGNFAIETNEMFMTLARRYEMNYETLTIKDLTTYIDPTKFNYAFAQTDIEAMNFWVQIGCDITARRKMSAKLMPNL